MLDRTARNGKKLEEYRLRILGSLAFSLLLVWAGFRWWPLPGPYEPADINYDVRGQEIITMEEIAQTRQEVKTPPPPAPLPPVVVPDDVVLEDIELVFRDDFLAIENTGADAEAEIGVPIGDNMSFRADSGPKPVKIVQPKYTREARRKKVRAEIVLEVLVDDRGQVSEIRVIERYLLNKDKTEREAVDIVGYGLEEAAHEAASGWIFRPAREGGKAVRSYTTLIFSFGI